MYLVHVPTLQLQLQSILPPNRGLFAIQYAFYLQDSRMVRSFGQEPSHHVQTKARLKLELSHCVGI
jgi:hypothetical protein